MTMSKKFESAEKIFGTKSNTGKRKRKARAADIGRLEHEFHRAKTDSRKSL